MSPKLNCIQNTEKYLLFAVNLFFAIAGLVLLFIGVAIQVKLAYVTKALGEHFQVTPISAMVIGGVVFVIAFFGCCGAIKENFCMLITFAAIMIFLMVIKILIAVLIFTQLDYIVGQIPATLGEIFAKKDGTFNKIETSFKCCGPDGAPSYPEHQLPASCCPPTVNHCKAVQSYDSCKTVLRSYFRTHGYVVGYIALAVGVIELLAAIMAIRLATASRDKKRSTAAQ